MSKPKIDVVILTHNDELLLQTAVASALTSLEVDVTVWVIDNASDHPITVIDDQRVNLQRNATNLGVGGGRNQGIRFGSAPLVCILDSDACLQPYSLAMLSAPLDDPTIGMSVPVFDQQLPSQSAGYRPTVWLKLQRGLGLRDTYDSPLMNQGSGYWDVDFGIGACQLFHRDLYHKVGGIDDKDKFGPEDLDFCLRIRQEGFRIVQVPYTGIIHPPRRAHRNLLSGRGIKHAFAIFRYYLRNRHRPHPLPRSDYPHTP